MNRLFLLLLTVLSCSVFAHEYDPDVGEEINEVCAGCHGEFGQGGKQGKYPRLAGLPKNYIFRELQLFRNRHRPNMDMIEYIDDRQMPDDDAWDIAQYLSEIKLKTKLPPADIHAPGFDAYQRLLDSKHLMQVPLYRKGNIKRGKKLFNRECKGCHGREGVGKGDVPMLSGQYTQYLKKQIEHYEKKIRIHDASDPDEDFFKDFSEQELDDIWAYLSIVDD